MSQKRPFAIAVCGIILLLIFSVTAFHRMINADAVVRMPSPRMPSPNAYDVWTAAADALVDKEKVWAAIGPRTEGGFSLSQKRSLVRRNAKALALFEKGMGMSYMHPPIRYSRGIRPYSNFRYLSRLLQLRTSVAMSEGDLMGVCRSSIETIEYGSRLPRGGDCLVMLNGEIAQWTGRLPLWRCVDRLNAEQARAVARQIEAIVKSQAPLSDALEEEKWHAVARLLDVFREKDWRDWIGDSFNSPKKTGFDAVLWKLRKMTCSKRGAIARCMDYMDAEIAKSRLPYIRRSKSASTTNDPALHSFIEPGIIDAYPYFYAINTTQSSLLMVKLALQAYRLDHGCYPSSLSSLVPGYLSKIPEDPFALNSPLGYRLQQGKALLYSIGPDCKDDGGRRIWNPQARAGREAFIYSDSKGDIMAGVNTD